MVVGWQRTPHHSELRFHLLPIHQVFPAEISSLLSDLPIQAAKPDRRKRRPAESALPVKKVRKTQEQEGGGGLAPSVEAGEC